MTKIILFKALNKITNICLKNCYIYIYIYVCVCIIVKEKIDEKIQT